MSKVVRTAHDCDCAALPGAFTPTETQQAHEHGADLVTVFPASTLGMDVIGAVRAPLPHLNLIPTGGVTLSNAPTLLEAGDAAVGIGSALVNRNAIANGNYDILKKTHGRPGKI